MRPARAASESAAERNPAAAAAGLGVAAREKTRRLTRRGDAQGCSEGFASCSAVSIG